MVKAEKVIAVLRTGIKIVIAASIVFTFFKNIIPRTSDTIVIGESSVTTEQAEYTEQEEQPEQPAPVVTTISSSAATSSFSYEEPPTDDSPEPVNVYVSSAVVAEAVPAEVTTVTTYTNAEPRSAPEPTEQPQSGLININTASSEQLITLNGIGEVKAQAIIDYREENGPFTDVGELINVKGIGEKTLEKIRNNVTV